MKGNARKAGKAILILFILIAFAVSCYFVFRPWFMRSESRRNAEVAADTFLQTYRPQTPTVQPTTQGDDIEPVMTEDNTYEPMPRAELYEAMQAYNEKIYAEGQGGLCDPWSYTAPAIDLSSYGLEMDEAIGVLQIPSIDISLPIYSGASYDNLAKGAAVLSQTSLPIGGENTNTVIGAHRGWNAEDYLRDVEDVQLGDEIIVTNYWEELHYKVTEIKIIKPNDINQILIQDGRELLTVFTCHPYASGGKYRYLLICDRIKAVETEDENVIPAETELYTDASSTLPTIASEQSSVKATACIEGEEFKSASTEIWLVSIIPWIGTVILSVLLVFVLTVIFRKGKE